MTGDTAQILQLHFRSFIENNYKIPSTAVDLWFTGMVTTVPSVVVLWDCGRYITRRQFIIWFFCVFLLNFLCHLIGSSSSGPRGGL